VNQNGSPDEREPSGNNSSRACARPIRADHRARVRHPFPVADRRHPVGAGHRQERQPRHPQLFADAPTPQAMLALGERAWLAPYINRIGSIRARRRNVIATCHQLLETARRRSAAARAANSKRCPGSAARRPTWFSTRPSASRRSPSTRTFSASPTAPAWHRGRRRWQSSTSCCGWSPQEFRQSAHHWLILHGRYVCKARKPECWRCAIADLCDHPEKASPAGRQ
jgi:endonuclease-3